jgi:hypothetical protein
MSRNPSRSAFMDVTVDARISGLTPWYWALMIWRYRCFFFANTGDKPISCAISNPRNGRKKIFFLRKQKHRTHPVMQRVTTPYVHYLKTIRALNRHGISYEFDGPSYIKYDLAPHDGGESEPVFQCAYCLNVGGTVGDFAEAKTLDEALDEIMKYVKKKLEEVEASHVTGFFLNWHRTTEGKDLIIFTGYYMDGRFHERASAKGRLTEVERKNVSRWFSSDHYPVLFHKSKL